MDVKLNSTTARAKAAVEAVRSQASQPQAGSQPSTRTDDTQVSTADTSATSSLQELGKSEAHKLHQELLDRLRDEIKNGTYQPRLDVVAERVADVLGAV